MTEPTTPARPPFKVSGMASIKHLNVRKEGPDDEKILAVDVKLEFKNVDRRLCGYFDDALEAFLWRGNTDALIARNMFLSPVQYGNEIASASVQIGGESYVGCDAKKFAMEARDGGVMNLTCSVSLYPTSSDVSALAKLVQEEASVTIEGPPDLFDAVSASTAAAKLESTLLQDGLSATLSTAGGEVLATFGEQDPMYGQAVEVVLENRKASISLVQRHLKIGYNRAARLVEDMERGGVVSAMAADGSRKVIAA
jgi:hypothetical protein